MRDWHLREGILLGSGPLLVRKGLLRVRRHVSEVHGLPVTAHGGGGLVAHVTSDALDLRGHGRPEGERLFVEAFGDYVADVAGVVALSKTRREPRSPSLRFGSSKSEG